MKSITFQVVLFFILSSPSLPFVPTLFFLIRLFSLQLFYIPLKSPRGGRSVQDVTKKKEALTADSAAGSTPSWSKCKDNISTIEIQFEFDDFVLNALVEGTIAVVTQQQQQQQQAKADLVLLQLLHMRRTTNETIMHLVRTLLWTWETLSNSSSSIFSVFFPHWWSGAALWRSHTLLPLQGINKVHLTLPQNDLIWFAWWWILSVSVNLLTSSKAVGCYK